MASSAIRMLRLKPIIRTARCRRCSRAFAKLSEPGVYESHADAAGFFRAYFLEQLEKITADFDVKLEVVNSTRRSRTRTCSSTPATIDAEALPPAEFARWFPTPDLQEDRR